MNLYSIVLDCQNAEKLCSFYEELLGWERKVYDHGEGGFW